MHVDVTIDQGQLRGRERKGVALFAGIPYAAAPVDHLRWAAPRPASGWDGVREATRFGPAAPQLPGDGLTNSHAVEWDEDCLTLNVMTPAADGGARPVMVWIHGGAFRTGTGAVPWYDGTRFARDGDIVVVTINYRLGALGFCQLDGEPTSGINGLLDQITALEWVRDNIAAFGGDPSRVTIAGESAGGMSVATLTAMDRAAGLFAGAIPQSGAAHNVIDAETAADIGRRTLDALGATDLDDARKVPADRLLAAQAVVEKDMERESTGMPYSPSFGHAELPKRAIDLIAAGAGADVPMLTGTNSDETTLFGLGSVTEDRLERVVSRYSGPVEELLAAYRADAPAATAGELAVAYTTDATFRQPAIRLAEHRHEAGGATWMYEFAWKSRAFNGSLGATHALEIPFAFNVLDAAGADVFLGPGDTPAALAQEMHDVWTRFIHEGDAGWAPYTPDERVVMTFDEVSRVVTDPDREIREAWAGGWDGR